MHTVNFFVDERHVWLHHERGQMHNIGADGRNLTIVLLSLNRSALTIRLLKSLKDCIPHFAGKILVADNGSAPDELAKVEGYLNKECDGEWELLRLEQNFGVAGGRNRAFAHVKTEWILSLDNDIYFVTNPFPTLQKDLAVLGCHFLSVPLLTPDNHTFFSFGGHLQTEFKDGRPQLKISSLLRHGATRDEAKAISPEGNGFLCSFLYGGASVLRRDTFAAVGPFDEAMFVGFEDIDYSLRLFNGGYKVGSAAIASLVHDHPPAEALSDKNYEKARYSREILATSAEYLERKTGFKIWDEDLEAWLRAREDEQGLRREEVSPAKNCQTGSRRPRIALVTDTQDWAFANISRQIMRHLGDRYDFEMIPILRMSEIQEARWLEHGGVSSLASLEGGSLGRVLLQSGEYDVIHIFWREILTLVGRAELGNYAKYLGLTPDGFYKRFIASACITTCVYDHLFLSRSDMKARRSIFNKLTADYYVSSDKLDGIYRSYSGVKPPAAVIEDGVDLELFSPRNLDRFDTVGEREIVIGWVGNSRWAAGLGDKKGFHTILKPAVEQLRAEGLAVRLETADRQNGFIAHDEMADYYSKIDLYVCASEIEGTPNPVLESMACGVPVISTDVGIVPQVFGPAQRPFILAERSIDCLKAAIRKLVAEPALFRTLSEENLQQIKPWDWRHQTQKFAKFFDKVLADRRDDGEVRTKICTLPFTTPSIETSGAVRLCSASSTFAYRDETNMGNARELGLEEVWRGEKFKRVRTSLFSGRSLEPYCQNCEYRFDGPAWLLQLHLGLHSWHNGIRDDEVRRLLQSRSDRYDEYFERAASVGLVPYGPVTLPADEAVASQGGIPVSIADGKDLPIFIDFNTLNRCNVACVMCPPSIRYANLGHAKDPYFRLTTEDFEKLTAGLNLKSAHFVGAYAEPLLNKEIFDLVQTGHDRGAFTAITSNAMLLSEDCANKLIDAGLNMLSISLHGSRAEISEAIMRKSDFAKVVTNIRALQRIKAERGISYPDIYFNFVGQLANVDDMADFIHLAADLKVLHVNIIHLIDGDEDVDRSLNLVQYPDRLAPNVKAALEAGRNLGVNVYVSPAYLEVADAAEQG